MTMAKQPKTTGAAQADTNEAPLPQGGTSHLYAATFARRLRELREARNLSKSDLAKMVWGTMTDSRGYTVSRNRDRVSVYEDGKAVPSQENLKQLADALGVAVGDLAPDLVTSKTSTAKKPAISMSVVEGATDRAVLTINCQVSLALAAQIIQMISSDPVAVASLK